MVITKDIISKYKKAGKISKECKEFGRKLAIPGANYLEISEKIEAKIRKMGADLAFPVNMSVNSVAAHYCAIENDSSVLKEGDLLKLDIGVQIDGYIIDSAISIPIKTKKHDNLILAAREALDNAVKFVKPGIYTSDIGEVIESTIQKHGFKSIRNLSGHGIEQYNVHAGYNIPNYKSGGKFKLEKGMVIAIEPFATDGRGLVTEGKSSGIYELADKKQTRMYRDVLNHIISTYQTLPFSEREVSKKFGRTKTKLALGSFARAGILHDHKILNEKPGSHVAQFEYTIIVDDEPIVLG